MVPSKGDVFTKHMEFHRTQDILNLKLKNKLRKNSSTLKAFIFLVKVNLCSALCTLTMSEYDPERQSVIRLQTKTPTFRCVHNRVYKYTRRPRKYTMVKEDLSSRVSGDSGLVQIT